MKALKIFLVLSFIINPAFALSLKIIDIDEPLSSSENYFIFASNGKVYEIPADDNDLIELAKVAMDEQSQVEITLSEAAATENTLERINRIAKIALISTERPAVENYTESEKEFTGIKADIKNTYVTDFATERQANRTFIDMRTLSGRSECYNRAHVWAYELNKKVYRHENIQVGKIWLFFTRKYIREYRYKWWFHVSPYVTVRGNVRVIDHQFTRGPLWEKTWTDIFIRSRQTCPEVYQYSDYEQYQYDSHCYVIKSSLYYWQPWHLEYAESRDIERYGWVRSELNIARRDVRGGWWEW